MGVWHISGLGKSPGAITVPLTYIYVFLSEALKGDQKATEFFKHSGELQKSHGEEIKGAPEAIVLFSSKEIIQGKIAGDWKDNWFKTNAKTIPEAIKKYLFSLFEDLARKNQMFSNLKDNLTLKNIYLVEVDHQDFKDCYRKAYITTAALKDKEIWVNITGGTNPINAGIFLAATFNASLPYRFYYLFQNDVKLMHPECDRSKICSEIPPPTWHDIPFFSFGMGDLYKKLKERFDIKEKVSIGEIKGLLQELGYGPIFEKLRGRVIEIEGEIAKKGWLLKTWEEMEDHIKHGKDLNSSTWQKLAQAEGWLHIIGGSSK